MSDGPLLGQPGQDEPFSKGRVHALTHESNQDADSCSSFRRDLKIHPSCDEVYEKDSNVHHHGPCIWSSSLTEAVYAVF